MARDVFTASAPTAWPTCTPSSPRFFRPAWNASSRSPRRRNGGTVAPTPAETSVVEHEVRVAARPETVFSYFTDPVKMVQWMGAEATLDPRPGGVCRIAFAPSRQRVESLSDAFGAQRERARERFEA